MPSPVFPRNPRPVLFFRLRLSLLFRISAEPALTAQLVPALLAILLFFENMLHRKIGSLFCKNEIFIRFQSNGNGDDLDLFNAALTDETIEFCEIVKD